MKYIVFMRVENIQIWIIAMSFLTIACSENVSELADQRFPVEVYVSVASDDECITRTTSSLDDNRFSLKTSANSSSAVCIIANSQSYQYSITGDTDISEPDNPPYFPYQSTSVQVYAWYPYNSGNTSFSIKTDQQNDASYCLSDLMLAQPANCTRAQSSTGAWVVTSANLTFRHVMSKVSITVQNSSGITITAITLNNVKPTVSINTTPDGSGGVSVVSAGAASGSASNVTLWTGSSTASSITASAVIPAQTIKNNFITISTSSGDVTYSLGESGKAFAQNTLYTATLSIGYQNIEQTIDISAWGKQTGSLIVNPESNNTFGNVNASLNSDTRIYNAAAFKPTPTVTYTLAGQSATTLTANTHYTYKYTESDGSTEIANPINAGSYYCVITGKNGYSGSVKIPFTITRRNILANKTEFTWETRGSIYTGSPVTPTPTITDDALSRTMVVGSGASSTTGDFYYSYSLNNQVGTANISITGINNYQGTITSTFPIVSITPSPSSTTAFVYKGLTGLTDNTSTTFSFTAPEAITSRTITSNSTSIATVSSSLSNSNKTCTVTVSGEQAGNTTLSINFTTANYDCKSYTYNVTVLKSLKLNMVPANQTSLVGCAATSNGFIYATGADATSASEIVIGMICYVGAAGSADASSTTYKGLIIGKTHNSTRVDWSPEATSSYSSTYWKYGYYADNMARCKADMWGLTYTNRMNSSTWGTSYANYAGAKAVAIGNAIISAPVQSMTSKWFLPAVGQFVKAVNMTYKLKSGTGKEIFTDSYVPGSATVEGTFLNTINSALTSAGCTEITAGDYWTSSECSASTAVNPDIATGSFRLDISGTTKTNNTKFVRPFLAF